MPSLNHPPSQDPVGKPGQFFGGGICLHAISLPTNDLNVSGASQLGHFRKGGSNMVNEDLLDRAVCYGRVGGRLKVRPVGQVMMG